MEFDAYQKAAAKNDTFKMKRDLKSTAFMEKVLGLAGESGEVVDKVKKILRDHKGKLNDEAREAVLLELGDVLWYVASIARYLDEPLSGVALKNLVKLESRRARGKIHGEGDQR